MRITRRSLVFGAMGAAVLPARAAVAGTQFTGGPAFGSSWRATFDQTVKEGFVRQRVQSIVSEVDACFSPYRSGSVLSRFNAARTLLWQPVSPDFAKVARTAKEISRLTDGCFDPTVGPLVARHGFGPISGEVATFAEIEVAAFRLRKASRGATLDLCGIAKGYALDRIAQALQDAGIGRAIIDVGGEVKALGSHPDGRPWTVAIADPDVPGRARHIVSLEGQALATSGHATNAVRGRVSTSHVIDPHRQSPARQKLRSVSVLDRSAMRADALATAFCAAGPEVGPDLARRLGVPSLFILEDAEVVTGSFETHLLT